MQSSIQCCISNVIKKALLNKARSKQYDSVIPEKSTSLIFLFIDYNSVQKVSDFIFPVISNGEMVGKLSVVVEGTFMHMHDFLLSRNTARCVCSCQIAKWFNTCLLLKQALKLECSCYKWLVMQLNSYAEVVIYVNFKLFI
jgi:hypothetical protein